VFSRYADGRFQVMIANSRRAGGFTLIELMVTIVTMSALAAVVAVSVVSRINSANIINTKQKLEAIQYATDLFYRGHCKDGVKPSATIAAFVSEAYLENAEIAETPFNNASSFVPSIAWGTPSLQTMSLNLGSAAKATQLSLALDATSVAGSTLSWTRMVRQRTGGLSPNRDFVDMFETPCQ